MSRLAIESKAVMCCVEIEGIAVAVAAAAGPGGVPRGEEGVGERRPVTN
jgi:hypothetical protein